MRTPDTGGRILLQRIALVTIPILLGAAQVRAATTTDLAFTPAAIDFKYTVGNALPAAQTLQIKSTGTAQAFTIQQPAAQWISLAAYSGTTPASIKIYVNPTSLPSGASQASLAISCPGCNTTSLTYLVTLAVSDPPPTLVPSTLALSFTYATDHASFPVTQNIVLASTATAHQRGDRRLGRLLALGAQRLDLDRRHTLERAHQRQSNRARARRLHRHRQDHAHQYRHPVGHGCDHIDGKRGRADRDRSLAAGRSRQLSEYHRHRQRIELLHHVGRERRVHQVGHANPDQFLRHADHHPRIFADRGRQSAHHHHHAYCRRGLYHHPRVHFHGLSARAPGPRRHRFGKLRIRNISPGEIITIYGLGLGPANLSVLTVQDPLATALPVGGAAQTSVTIDGVAAPLLYAGANEIGCIVPFSVAAKAGSQVNLSVTYNSIAVASPTKVNVVAANPGLFTADASGTGEGAILNFNPANGAYTVNSSSNPAVKGVTTAILYMTGFGVTSCANIPASGAHPGQQLQRVGH